MANMYTVIPGPPINDLENLYLKNKMSQNEIGQLYGVSQKVVWRWIKKNGLKKKAVKRNQNVENNNNWKFSKIGKPALHYRVRRKFGNKKECEICDKNDPKSLYDWANISGLYLDVFDFMRLCRLCHRSFDHNRDNILIEGILN